MNRCKEIAKYGINGIDGINKIRDLVANEERANILFKPVEIASEATAKAVFEKLNERLSKYRLRGEFRSPPFLAL